MVLQQRRPQAGLLHHSDQGCQYTSQQYQEVLTQFGISVSMSRRGNCYDNAVSESFFERSNENVLLKAAFRRGHKPDKRSLSIQNVFTIGFDDTPR
jgi:putative transposase